MATARSEARGAPQRNPGEAVWQDVVAAENTVGRTLSLLSLGLGLAQVAAPRDFARWIGAPDSEENENLVRLVGIRELVSGFGLLAQPDNALWRWMRVGGDIMDIALLAGALSSPRAEKDRLAAALAAVLGVTALDLGASAQSTDVNALPLVQKVVSQNVDVHAAITLNRPVAEVYEFWHNFENLPRFMRHLESVRVHDGEGRRSHWRAKAPAGLSVEWDAVMTEDRPNELIGWRTVENSDVPNEGVVRFKQAPGGRGTEVEVKMQYLAPGGPLGVAIARLFGEEPSQQVHSDLRRFKQIMETGEVVVSAATVDGPTLIQRPAQPPEHAGRSKA